MESSPPSIDGTLGSGEIGLVLATFLYGIETLQTFNYYHDCTKDVVFLRILVASIWFLELAHLICGCHAMYVMTVTFYGQSENGLEAPVSLVFTILFHAIITIVVQSYFPFRVGILLKRWHMTILCCLFSLLRLIGYLVLFVNLTTSAPSTWIPRTPTGIQRVVWKGNAPGVRFGNGEDIPAGYADR
ncbi:hypothetical protein B0H14DRAFT_3440016 [Mycena olivaceomarginata]|nr:hypothetical protein B0H14DRAFT_3440016 [Mycena olivaceomarginata]